MIKTAYLQCKLINSDVLDGLQKLPDKSVHTVITSPPYWGLRDYGIDGQIGLEPTLKEYISKITDVFDEIKRVLRNDGTLWLNIGDKYETHNPIGKGDTSKTYIKKGTGKLPRLRKGSFRRDKLDVIPNLNFESGLCEKNLIGVPWRIALALQERGWILRSEIIWDKPNPMPESIKDRPTKSHENIFLFTKLPRYFYDAEAVREPQTGNTHPKGKKIPPKTAKTGSKIKANLSYHEGISKYTDIPGGRNLRTIWTIPTQPRPEAHFATFPDELARRCILAGSSEYGCCPECGAPWKRIVKSEGGTIGKSWHDHNDDLKHGQKAPSGKASKNYKRYTQGWEPGCTCSNKNPIPCIVLDPFGGSGTVADIARSLNRSSISIDLNPEYIELQKKRLKINEQLDTGICSYEIIKGVDA